MATTGFYDCGRVNACTRVPSRSRIGGCGQQPYGHRRGCARAADGQSPLSKLTPVVELPTTVSSHNKTQMPPTTAFQRHYDDPNPKGCIHSRNSWASLFL